MAIYSEFSHEKWWFSIVMLVYQRVSEEMSQKDRNDGHDGHGVMLKNP